MASNCSVNPTHSCFTSWIASNLVWHLHRWFLPKTTEKILLIVEYLQGWAHHFGMATTLSETNSKSKATPWKWMVGIFDPFLFRGRTVLFLGRVTKWWCYFLASQAGGKRRKYPRILYDLFVQSIHRNNPPEWLEFPPMFFVYFGFLSYMFVYWNRLREAIEASNNHEMDTEHPK